MNRPTSIRTRSTGRRKFAVAIAGLFAIGSITQNVTACDYCDQGDGGIVCDAGCDSSCDSYGGLGIGTPKGPIFKTLDAFAGRLEKIIGFDKCVPCDAGCDNACDAMMIDELMYPMAPATTEHYHAPVVPSVPPETYSQPFESYSQPVAPPVQHQYVEPTVPQPVPERPAPTPAPVEEKGGLFDTLDNPFHDDEVRRSSRRKIQPSSYQKDSARVQPSRSISKYLNSASAKTSVQHQHASPHVHRASTSQRSVGSSLKRAAARPVAMKPTATHSTHRHTVHHAQNQVKLSKAPVPTKQVSSARATPGQRQTTVKSKSHGHTTQGQAALNYYRR